MLTIGKIHAQNKGYFESQIAQGRDDYYEGRGEAPGEWKGSAAQGIGLEGEVDGDEFNALLEARAPDGRGLIAGNPGGSSVLAYDLTFSAPKSVSMLFAIGAPEQVEAVSSAHDEAVSDALRYLESEACQVRRGAGGRERLPAAGFAAAAYRHRFSRAGDPQLHTHVVTANIAQAPDGRFSRLYGAVIYRHAKTAGYLYQAALREGLRERLPWIRFTQVRNGAAEIKGLDDPDFLKAHSRRAVEIEAARAEIGASRDPRTMHALGLKTRPSKPELPAEWRAYARARAAEFGIDARHLEALARERGTEPAKVDQAALAEELSSPHGLTEMRNTFSEREVLQAYAEAARDGESVASIRDRAPRYLARPEVRRLEAEVEPRHTTEELLSHERAILSSGERRRGEGEGWVTERTVAAVIRDRAHPLTAGQEQALRALARSPHGVEALEALAGSGKTTLSGALREAFEAEDANVVGAAPTGRAARELRERAGLRYAQTIDRLLGDLERDGGFGSKRTVLIVDEASMTHTRKLSQLISHSERERAKVIMLGDSGQLPAVGAGGAFRSICERFGAQELTEVLRQREGAERRALAQLHEGNPNPYLEHKQARGELQVLEGREAAERNVLERWWQRRGGLERGEEAVMICRSNDSRRRLNEGARELLREQGRLGESVWIEGRELAEGDRVICRRNDRAHDVDNGTRGTIAAVEPDGVTIRLDGGEERSLPAAYVRDHLDHAYALTGHGAQGGTVRVAEVLGAPEDFTQNWSYTALSRSQEPTGITVIAEPHSAERERAELAPESRSPATPIERTERAMRTRDDEALALDFAQPPALPDPEAAAERAQPSPLASLTDRELRARHASLSGPPQRSPELVDAERSLEEARRLRNRLVGEINDARTARLMRRPDAPDEAALALIERKIEKAKHLTRLREREVDELRQREPRPELAPRAEARRELGAELDRRVEQRIRSALVAPGEHIQDELGEAPLDPAKRGAWERGVKAIESHRFRFGIEGPDALGPRPKATLERDAWHQARRELERVQPELGRALDRDMDYGIGLSL